MSAPGRWIKQPITCLKGILRLRVIQFFLAEEVASAVIDSTVWNKCRKDNYIFWETPTQFDIDWPNGSSRYCQKNPQYFELRVFCISFAIFGFSSQFQLPCLHVLTGWCMFNRGIYEILMGVMYGLTVGIFAHWCSRAAARLFSEWYRSLVETV